MAAAFDEIASSVPILAFGGCTSKFRLPFAAADWLNCELETQTAKSYSG
jgi:hypothetical protein